MLSSLDGKISTGSNDNRDFDKDLPKIKRLEEGLKQYYELEQKTDLHSLNTGKVMAKIGMNIKKNNISKIPASFIIIDNKPHLTINGINNLLKKCQKVYIVTTNKKHPAFQLKEKNLKIILYGKKIDFIALFSKLKIEFGIKNITVQSGGTLNSILIRKGLIDEISIVIAPTLIGGKDTPTIFDGSSLKLDKDLKYIKTLELKKCEKLKNSYLHLTYKVNN